MNRHRDSRYLGTLILLLTVLPLGTFAGGADESGYPSTVPTVVPVPPQEPVEDLLSRTLQALAATAGTDVNVSNLAGNESEVSIDINPLNTSNQVIVGHSPDFENMNTFFTLDNGQTWTHVPLGDAEDGLTSDFRFDPTLAFDADGNVYVAYGATIPAGTGTDTTVVVAKSTDGGQTYTQFTRATTAPDDPAGTSLPGSDRWYLATGPDPSNSSQQNVYLTMTANLDDPGGLDQRIVLLPSYDGGQVFVTSIIVNDTSLGALNSIGNIAADPGIGPNGEVYVTWLNTITREIWVDVSYDGGLTFGTDSHVVTPTLGFRVNITPQPDRGTSSGPIIDVDRSGGLNDGRVYIAYADVASGGALPDTDVFVVYSDNQGAVWSLPTLVNDDGGSNSQFMPWLDVDPSNGDVAVAWYDARNDAANEKVEVFMSLSTDGGGTFEANTLVSDGQSDQSTSNANRTTNNFLEYIGIACQDDVCFLVWADNSVDPANLDYYTDHVTKGGTTNVPPVADAGVDQTVQVGDLVALDGSGSNDPDNGPGVLTYDWSQTGGPAVALLGSNTVSPTFTPVQAGTYTFSLVVNDGADDSAPDVVTVTVEEPPNQPPVADAGGDQTADIGDTVTLDGTGSNDPDNGPSPLTYLWTQTSGPEVTLAGATTSTATFVPTQPGTYIFSLVVNDGEDDSAPDSVTVTVQAAGGGSLQDLMDDVESLGLSDGLENSLLAKLHAAAASFQRGNATAAANQLKAFINAVNAQKGKKLTVSQANALIAAAQQAIAQAQAIPASAARSRRA